MPENSNSSTPRDALAAFNALPAGLSEHELLTFLQLCVENTNDEVFWMKADSEIIYVNRAACKNLGYAADELIGQRIWQWDPLFTEASWADFWQQLKQEKCLDFETEHKTKQGNVFPIQVKAHYLLLAGSEYLFAFVSDISDSKQQAHKLKQQSENLATLVEQKTAELQQEKKKFEEFVNHAPVGIVINRLEDGGFEYINTTFSDFTGYAIDELNAMDYWQLTPTKYEQQEQEQLQNMASIGRYGPYQKEYIHKDGHTYPVLLSGIKITDTNGKDYIWSIVQDISQQLDHEHQLEQAKQQADRFALRMKIANDSAGIGVWEWDLTTNALVWDEWMYRLYGIAVEDFSGAYEAWENGVHPQDLNFAKSRLEQAIAGEGVYNPEFRIIKPSGEVRTLKASAEVLRDDDGKAYMVTGVNYDITDRVESLKNLAAAKEEAENANKAKSNFLANMSHEIRTPMNGMLGMLQLLKNSTLNDKQLNQLNIAVSSTKTLLVLINDILDYSKIEAGKLDIEAVEFDLGEQISELVKTFAETQTSASECPIKLTTENTLGQLVVGDPTRLRQIISNLISNAIKFSQGGPVEVAAKLQKNEHSGFRFYCSVKDSGIGISQDQLSTLFNEFTQADSSTTRKYGGTGLGLSICKRLCELMGGSISATSQPEQGSCFSFEVNLASPDAATDYQQTKPAELTSPSPNAEFFSKHRVLLVEDNEINTLVAQAMLQDLGVQVDNCINGIQAISAVEQGDYSLVLMDCQMPEMDGYESTRRIRNGEAGDSKKQIPIIAMTANAMKGDKELCIAAGMDDYIAKPIEEGAVKTTLSKWLLHLSN